MHKPHGYDFERLFMGRDLKKTAVINRISLVKQQTTKHISDMAQTKLIRQQKNQSSRCQSKNSSVGSSSSKNSSNDAQKPNSRKQSIVNVDLSSVKDNFAQTHKLSDYDSNLFFGSLGSVLVVKYQPTSSQQALPLKRDLREQLQKAQNMMNGQSGLRSRQLSRKTLKTQLSQRYEQPHILLSHKESCRSVASISSRNSSCSQQSVRQMRHSSKEQSEKFMKLRERLSQLYNAKGQETTNGQFKVNRVERSGTIGHKVIGGWIR